MSASCDALPTSCADATERLTLTKKIESVAARKMFLRQQRFVDAADSTVAQWIDAAVGVIAGLLSSKVHDFGSRYCAPGLNEMMDLTIEMVKNKVATAEVDFPTDDQETYIESQSEFAERDGDEYDPGDDDEVLITDSFPATWEEHHSKIEKERSFSEELHRLNSDESLASLDENGVFHLAGDAGDGAKLWIGAVLGAAVAAKDATKFAGIIDAATDIRGITSTRQTAAQKVGLVYEQSTMATTNAKLASKGSSMRVFEVQKLSPELKALVRSTCKVSNAAFVDLVAIDTTLLDRSRTQVKRGADTAKLFGGSAQLKTGRSAERQLRNPKYGDVQQLVTDSRPNGKYPTQMVVTDVDGSVVKSGAMTDAQLRKAVGKGKLPGNHKVLFWRCAKTSMKVIGVVSAGMSIYENGTACYKGEISAPAAAKEVVLDVTGVNTGIAVYKWLTDD